MNLKKEALLKPQITVPFLTTLVAGLIAHFPVLVNNLPNADAMSSFYFDQNMVTSGRWFLTIACGFSSYFDLKWLIGILSLLFLSVAAVLLTKLFEIKEYVIMGAVGALLVTFPAVSATFAYMYTADGYFMALAMSFAAVLVTKKYPKFGWAAGAVLLAFSMGTYQAYLAAAILLCLFDLILLCLHNRELKEILLRAARFLGMGILGGILYYVILKICLAVQGKELDTYQGINGMGKISLSKLPGMILGAYRDFGGFAKNGRIFLLNGFSVAAMVLLFGMALTGAILTMRYTKAYKKWYLSLLIVLFIILLPVGTNIILLISSEAFYHLLMRMQWGLYPVFALVLAENGFRLMQDKERQGKEQRKEKGFFREENIPVMMGYAALLGAILLSWQFVLSDNIAYFNMNERYEKTYAYLLRLADRIEQTEGYYTGMPVMMIGVVDEEKYPRTDITGNVTERIYGSTGDILVYKGEQYQAFMQHYLNVTLNVITDEDTIVRIYNSEAYREMDSFPAAGSVRVVDGILYVKTEPPEKL